MNNIFTQFQGISRWYRNGALALLALVCMGPVVNAQIILNCPSPITVNAANGQCSSTVTYSQPTTNAQTNTTQTFNFTGSVQSFTVPANVTSVNIQAWGGQGRTNSGNNIAGGRGGYATGNLAVTPGNTLYIYVGGGGGINTAGAYNGGGNAGAEPCSTARGGGGGGATDIRLNGTSLNARRLVAGGGGGAGGNRVQGCGRGSGGGGGGGWYGGGGGAAWPYTSTTLPGGGSQTSGGNAGISSWNLAGNDGTAGGFGSGGTGGDEVSSTQSGSGNALAGGVGGGTNGGGGAYSVNWTGQSGAGGSGYIGGVTGGSMSNGVRTGNGQVILSYNIPLSINQTAGLGSGANYPVGTTTNSFVVTQGSQSATCSFTVTVVDNQDPSLTCPSTQTVNLNSSCQALLADFRSQASAGDNCTANPTISQSPAAGAVVSGAGNQTITMTATDGSGNTRNCTFTLTKVDVTNPSINCPSNRTVNLNANCQVSLPDYVPLAGATDNCTASPSVTQSPVSGSMLSGTGTSTVTLTATDGAGRTANCNFTVTRVDVTAPSLSCPSNQTVNLNANCAASVPNFISQVSATDACTSNPTLSQSPSAGTLINSGGTQTITVTGTDGAGNNGNCTFTLTAVDNVNPSVNCPGNQTVNLNANCAVSLADYTNATSAADNCPVGLSLVQSPAAGATINGVGATTVTMTATDGSGNTDNCTFTVNRLDVTNPTLNCPTTATVTLNSNCAASLPNYAAQATIADNCTASPNVTQSPAAGSPLNGTGNTNVTLTVADGSGNTNSCTITVSKVDATAPAVSCPPNQSLTLNASCVAAMPNYVPQSSATDNCTGAPTRVQSPNTGSMINGPGNTTVTITATDGSGNNSNCTFTVTAVDNSNPTLSCPPAQTVSLNANCQAQVPDLTVQANATDNCSSPNLTQSPASGTIVSGSSAQMITITATDGSGNTDNCMVSVNFLDLAQPTVSCPPNTSIALNPNCEAMVPDYTAQASASDNCTANPVKSQSPAAGSMFTGGGPHTVTISTVDAANNVANCTFLVSGVDQVAPTIGCPAAQSIALDANCQVALPDFAPLSSPADNCTANPVVSQSPAPGTSFNGVQTTTVMLTVTDGSSLTANCSFTVNIEDQTGPSVTCPGMDTIYADAACEALLPDYTSVTTNVDNCSTILNLSQSPFGGTVISGAGTTTQVVMTALDQENNIGTCTLSVTLVDTLGPDLMGCPSIVEFTPTTLDCNPQVQWNAPTATDACAGSASLSSTHAPGDNFPVGTTAVTYTALDPGNNFSQCTFDVVVNAPALDGFITADNPVPCEGDTVTLNASAGLSGYLWSTTQTTQAIQVTTTGWYWVDLTDASNCSGRDSFFVDFQTAPAPVISVVGQDLCTTPFASYQWFLNGNVIPGATSQCFTPTGSGSFTVLVTAQAGGCETQSDPIQFVSLDNGLSDQDFSVYPNPTRDLLNIRMEQPLLESGSVMIYDVAGRIVQRVNFEMLESEMTLDLSQVSAGTYFVELVAGEFRGRRKVMRIR
ncbi:MAG: HYR domain-containing protein [Bacteroidota bacterium]